MASYKQVDPNLDLVSVEKSTLDRWKKINLFDLVNEKTRNYPRWVYFDGPITANGRPHYGHALTWTMKDILPRYYTMKNRFVSRNIGWDCQGILVEYEVEKDLQFQNKGDIEKYGIAKFNEQCRNKVLSNRSAMLEYEERLGRWVDHNDEYSTMDSKYIESMWWAIKQLYSKGLLYKGHKVVAYSTRAGMTLSTHEVADGGYKEMIDPAVTIKFKLEGLENTYVLAWTTTPWTLPGNLLVAMGKDIKYVKVLYEGEILILAKDLVEKVFEGKSYEIKEIVNHEDLLGRSYEPLFSYFIDRKDQGAFKIVYADHVNIQTGTGFVHLAPYGEEDFLILSDMKIQMFDYLDDTGSFNRLIPELNGVFYKKANDQIIQMLVDKNRLFKKEEYAHQMPMCYRTKTPLIYKPIESYYVAIEKIKSTLISEAEKVNFVPSLGKERFINWITNARDWSLSRRRYWGTPLPIWINDKNGEIIVVGSFKELEDLSGKSLGSNFDPHRPFVDDIQWGDEQNGYFKRVPEVIDVWFDSGSMTFSKHHYPFEHEKEFKEQYPAEFISEGDDQLRLWFYTMFVLGVSLFGSTPFLNVVVLGMLGDEKGKKMSKSAGNYPPIEEVFEKWGSDMLRYFLLKNGVARMEPTAFSYKALDETKKEFFTITWNSYRYFLTYAGLNNFVPKIDFKPTDELDKWILMRLTLLIKLVRENLDKYEVMFAEREFAPFVDDLSTWYIRRSRDRISSGDSDSLNTLYICLDTLSRLLAPFIPLFADELYTGINPNKQSVHLEEFPNTNEIQIQMDENLMDNMSKIRLFASVGNALRKEKNVPVKQPLKTMYVNEELDKKLIYILKDELNVKEIVDHKPSTISDNIIEKNENSIYVAFDITVDLDLELERMSREFIREAQKLRKTANVAWDEKIKLEYKSDEKIEQMLSRYKNTIMDKALILELAKGNEFRIIN